jgi:hypothetical protein
MRLSAPARARQGTANRMRQPVGVLLRAGLQAQMQQWCAGDVSHSKGVCGNPAWAADSKLSPLCSTKPCYHTAGTPAATASDTAIHGLQTQVCPATRGTLMHMGWREVAAWSYQQPCGCGAAAAALRWLHLMLPRVGRQICVLVVPACLKAWQHQLQQCTLPDPATGHMDRSMRRRKVA